MEMQMAVKTKNLSKVFDGHEVLKRCEIQVNEGEIYGILGANGAGKTTLLKLIMGLLESTEGSVEIFGREIGASRGEILKQIGSLIEVPYFYEHLSARENLSIHLDYMALEGDIDKALAMVGLKGVDKAVSKFSLGMKQRLAIARSFVHNPKVLLLDEPINGLDPVGIKEMRELFLKLARQGMTILISSHILSEIEQTVDRLAIIGNGRLVEELVMDDFTKEHEGKLEEYVINKMNGGFYSA